MIPMKIRHLSYLAMSFCPKQSQQVAHALMVFTYWTTLV
jgi:hypothetical protein